VKKLEVKNLVDCPFKDSVLGRYSKALTSTVFIYVYFLELVGH
jgi:hypothetical protein